MDRAIEAFKEFQGQPTVSVRAPGYLNLVGAFTDLYEGWSLNAATEQAYGLALGANGTTDQYVLTRLEPRQVVQQRFGDVPDGSDLLAAQRMTLVNLMRNELPGLPGFHCYIAGELPEGSGLAANAALLSGLAAGLNALAGGDLSATRLAQLVQQALSAHATQPAGIAAPLTLLTAKAGHVQLLDARSLEIQPIQAGFPDYRIMLIDPQVQHDHAAASRLTRRAEAEEGLQRIKADYPEVNSLRDLTKDMLSALGNTLPQNIFCRCAFILAENGRVQKSADDLAQGRWYPFGERMFETQIGLRDLYQATSPELDHLAELSALFDGCLGARMVGEGFGGSLLAIVSEATEDQFTEGILQRFQTHFGREGQAIPLILGAGIEVNKLSD